ncbi:MAG: response regulator transcription factor [Lachnospiraceae bacterium]|nr:response regulator transcription factor [Lachnospiraceae bacterium]
MYKIGILEDDSKLGNELKLFLESNGYEGRYIAPTEYGRFTEKDLIRLLENEKLSLLLLDIGLPGFDGTRICKAFREISTVPVIMITSDNSELTELMSLQYGADDFVPKPFNTRILLARIEMVLRRSNHSEVASSDVTEVRTESGATFSFDKSKGRVKGPSGEETELSKNEFQILDFLVKNQGKIVSRDDIMSHLWDNEAFVDDNTLTVNMTRLRGKLEAVGLTDVIATKRGMGYILL